MVSQLHGLPHALQITVKILVVFSAILISWVTYFSTSDAIQDRKIGMTVNILEEFLLGLEIGVLMSIAISIIIFFAVGLFLTKVIYFILFLIIVVVVLYIVIPRIE